MSRGLSRADANLTARQTEPYTDRAKPMRLTPFFILLVVGCTPKSPAPAPNPGPATRVVSLAPALTEAVFAVGAGDQLVGVTNECDYPPAAKALPKVGGFGPRMLGAEAILATNPDLVLTIASYHKEVTDQVAGTGVRVVAFEPKTFADIAAMLRQIGQATGHAAEGEKLAAKIEAEVNRGPTPVPGQRPKVLIVVGTDPLYCAGPGTFLGQMVTLAGGENVLGASLGDYPQVGDEAILTRPPDVILLPDNMGLKPVESLKRRPGWSDLPAVKNGRVEVLPGDVVSRPGPRVLEGLAAVRGALAGK